MIFSRRPRLVRALGALALSAFAMNAAPGISCAAEHSLGGTHERTRFIIGLEKPVQFQVFSLTNPNRVVVELPNVKAALPEQDGGKPIGLVKSFRGGLASADKLRVVLDVTEPVVVAKSAVEKSADGKGHQLTLEFVPFDSTDKSKASKKFSAPSALGGPVQPPLPLPAVSPKQKAERTYKPIIVIDPGHGGMDSGATKNGTVEKEVVLAFGLALRDKLVATGQYKVLMTRSDDTFIPLDERRAIAERANAALFIAIHADYSDNGSKARGATIFSLRDGVAEDLKASTKAEVAKQVMSGPQAKLLQKADGDMDAVKGILEDLARQEVEANKDRSKLFAGAVIETMSEQTDMRSSPDQQAAFRVLKTAQFPSVLIELGYVTNRQDADNLKSDEWRSEVAHSIVTAVDNYFHNNLAHLPM